MREYIPRLERFGISAMRMRELWSIGRQYDEMRRRAGVLRSARRGERDPTGEQAAELADSWDRRRVRMIEACARTADAEIWRELLKNVARGVSYEHMDAPCGRRQFYAARRRFYVELDRRMREDEM